MSYQEFGPPAAIINISKMGYRYYHFYARVCDKTKELLAESMYHHPNVGWVIACNGWANLLIAIWAKNNAELSDVLHSIGDQFSVQDEVVAISEVTHLKSYVNRAIGKTAEPAIMVDPTIIPIDITPRELDYLKLVALDGSLTSENYSQMLGITQEQVQKLHASLVERKVILGTIPRINLKSSYYKVLVDTRSRITETADKELMESLEQNKNVFYIMNVLGKHDVDFEIQADDIKEVAKLLQNFRHYEIFSDNEFLFTNLLPINKTANLMEIKEAVFLQEGTNINLQNSKLWYLNYDSADAYINIDKSESYSKAGMVDSEYTTLFEACDYLKTVYKNELVSLIDLGSGNGVKGRRVCERLGEANIKAYYPIDIQPIELGRVLEEHRYKKYPVYPVVVDIEKIETRFPILNIVQEHQLYIFLGGTYGNFEQSEINKHIKKLLAGNDNKIIVTMPIRDSSTHFKDIVDGYSTIEMEAILFGPLLQLGFKRQDFVVNEKVKGLVMHIDAQDGYIKSKFILNRDLTLQGRTFKRGTTFHLYSGWKPTLEEFEKVLKIDFEIEKMFVGNGFAQALLVDKR